MKTFSLIIPSSHRTQQLRGLLDSLAACTECLADLEVILVVDSDDEETLQFTHGTVALKKVQVPPGTPMGTLNAAGFEQAAGDYLMLVNDDVIVRTRGWDRRVFEAFQKYPDGITLVHVNDLFFKDELCIFPFLTRQFCVLAGGICPTGYIHYGIDNHIQYTFESLRRLGYDRRIYLPDVVFEHTNVQITSGGPARYVPDPAIHEVDVRLLESLSAERDRVARAAARHIEQVRPPSSPRVTVAVLSADFNSAQARKCVELLRSCTSQFHLILAAVGAPESTGAEMNRILAACSTGYLVLMRDDVFVQPGWLDGMLRSMEQGVGVVTPVHRDARGRAADAGIAILPDGSSGPILAPPDELRCIQAPATGLMIIDMAKCGHVRFDEQYRGDVRIIDFGLRVWEAGFQVVCSDEAEVTCATRNELPEPADVGHFHQCWIESPRLVTLRETIWKQFPEICLIGRKVEEIDRLMDCSDAEEIARRAPDLVRSVAIYPALKNYIATLAMQRMADRPLRVDQPECGHWALLCGLSGRPVLYESGFHGCNIILQDFTYYAVPEQEGARYLRTLEADNIDTLKRKIRESARASSSAHIPRGTIASRPSLTDLIPTVTAHSPVAAGSTKSGTNAVHASTAQPSGNLLLHFCSEGVQQGLKPNPLFDPAYYLATNPDVAALGVNPLAHFLDSSALRRPNPLFDPAYYFRQYPDAAASGLNPLEHFLEAGAAKGYKPCPLFDTAYYLAQHPELVAGGINPLAHFLDSGAKAGYKPNPLFDTSYYVQRTANLGAMNPLVHFIETGGRQGDKPSALFDAAYYLAQNPDVAASGMNPLQHFLETGTAEGRKPDPFFDPAYYLAENPEVKQGQNPLVHFLETGAEAGRRPNPLFDCNYYLLQNPEAAQSGINPLIHFLEHTPKPASRSIASGFYGSPNGHKPGAAAKLSVVIATRDQAENLSRTLEACGANRGSAEIEIIVVDAGSRGGAIARLKKMAAAIPGLRYYSLENSTLSRARNIGADLARNDVILFLDQRACPQYDDFFHIHASLHGRYSDANLAVLGSAGASSREPVVSVLQKLLGRGAAQFGNLNLTPFAFAAWPFFDTANLSVKKTFVADWILDGFDPDCDGQPFADLDLACRVARSPEGIRLFHNPAARVLAGRQALPAELEDHYLLGHAIAQLLSRNPELACDCTPDAFLHELRSAQREVDENTVADYRRVIDGFKAWARINERDEVPSATRELFLLDGFATAWIESGGDAAIALPLLANRFQLASAGLSALVLGD